MVFSHVFLNQFEHPACSAQVLSVFVVGGVEESPAWGRNGFIDSMPQKVTEHIDNEGQCLVFALVWRSLAKHAV